MIIKSALCKFKWTIKQKIDTCLINLITFKVSDRIIIKRCKLSNLLLKSERCTIMICRKESSTWFKTELK